MYLDDSLTQAELDEANQIIRLQQMPAIDRWDYWWAGGEDVDIPTQEELGS